MWIRPRDSLVFSEVGNKNIPWKEYLVIKIKYLGVFKQIDLQIIQDLVFMDQRIKDKMT